MEAGNDGCRLGKPAGPGLNFLREMLRVAWRDTLRALRWAYAIAGLTPGERYVLAYLAFRVNGRFECWPSQATMGKALGLTRQTVNIHLGMLTSYGFVERFTHTEGWMGYRLNVGATLPPLKGKGVGNPDSGCKRIGDILKGSGRG